MLMWSTTPRKASYILTTTAEPKAGALIAKLKGKPELSAESFDGITAHQETSTNTGGDFKAEFQTYRDGLSDAKQSKLYSQALINPKKGVKKIAKDAKKVGYEFDKDESGQALNEVNQQGAFIDVELESAALDAMVGKGRAMMFGTGSGKGQRVDGLKIRCHEASHSKNK